MNVGVDFEVNHNLSHVSKSMRIDIGRGGSVSKLAEVAQSCFRKIIAPHNKFKVMGMSSSLTSFIKLEKCGIAMKSWIASKRSQQMKKVSSSSTETGSSMDKPFSSTS